jgi:hypothetical protein
MSLIARTIGGLPERAWLVGRLIASAALADVVAKSTRGAITAVPAYLFVDRRNRCVKELSITGSYERQFGSPAHVALAEPSWGDSGGL